MDAIRLIYQHNTTGLRYTKDFNALRIKGFDPVDSVSDFPDVLHRIIGGSLLPQNIGIKRQFTIEIGVVPYADRLFCANFFYASTKWLQYSHDGFFETIKVVNNADRLQTDWLNDVHIARYIVLNLQDKLILKNIPQANPNPPEYETMRYYKQKVLITGYRGSPETFTTNVGKLATCDAPAGAYPNFDSSVEKYEIIFSRVYQDCHFDASTPESTSGGNLTFTMERSNFGDPASDDSYYADIIIAPISIL